MGSFNINCAISRLPINDGEDIVGMFVGERYHGSQHYKTPLYPWDHWQILSFPIYTKMDDYGMRGYWGTEENESKWLESQDKYNAWAFKQFRKHIFRFGKDKHYPDGNRFDEMDWTRAMDGENDSRYAAWSYVDPEGEIAKTNPAVKSLYCRPVRFQFFIVRRDVYDYLLKNNEMEGFFHPDHNPIKGFNDWWDIVEKIKTLDSKDPEWNKLWFKASDIRRMEGVHPELQQIIRNIVDNKNNVVDKEIRNRIREECIKLITLTESLYIAQTNIQPNLGLAPQCGWYRDEIMEPMMDYYKFLVKIGQKKLKDIKKEFGE